MARTSSATVHRGLGYHISEEICQGKYDISQKRRESAQHLYCNFEKKTVTFWFYCEFLQQRKYRVKDLCLLPKLNNFEEFTKGDIIFLA